MNAIVPRRLLTGFCFVACVCGLVWLAALLRQPPKAPEDSGTAAAKVPQLSWFSDLRSNDPHVVTGALKQIEANWHTGSPIMLLETVRAWKGQGPSGLILAALCRNTGESFGTEVDSWHSWLWAQDFELHPEYAQFKADLYAMVDPRFMEYFDIERSATVRLDEICWGGVTQDSIPLLDHPAVVTGDAADWLSDEHVVFGIELNGQARCYPRRILAWHEMVRDNVGGQEINGVYCTLCGSMIVYDTTHRGIHYELGTSGFLYRSNKLMFDDSTKSLWSTLTGQPVMGPLVGNDITLQRLPVVTSTWGEWRARHPSTEVTSLTTGYERDYGEGVAYRDYFATDKLMFSVPKNDTRLANKQPIFAMRTDQQPAEQLAIDTAYLKENPTVHQTLADRNFVIFTDTSGASRAYWCGEVRFPSVPDNFRAIDSEGHQWTIGESQMMSNDGENVLPRAAAHQAFWFGWVNQFPDTRLIKHEAL